MVKVFLLSLTKDEGEGVSERGLAPHEPCGIDDLCRPIDVPTPNPSRRHRKDPHEHPNIPSSEHDLFLRVIPRLLLPPRPHPNPQDEDIEENNRNHAADKHLDGSRIRIKEQ